MKNKKLFIILSIAALSASYAHATLQEDFKQALEQIKAKLANDEKVHELLQAIAAKTATFKEPNYIANMKGYDEAAFKKYDELRKQWQKEIEELPAIAQLATKIKENFDEKTLQSIKEEFKELSKIELKKNAELEALKAKYEPLFEEHDENQSMKNPLPIEYWKNRSKINNKPEYKHLDDAGHTVQLFIQELQRVINNNSTFLSPGWQHALINPLLEIE